MFLNPIAPLLLRPRETEVAHWIARGLSNEEIGERLVIAPATVSVHIQRIHLQANTHTRQRLVFFLNRYGYGLLKAGESIPSIGATGIFAPITIMDPKDELQQGGGSVDIETNPDPTGLRSGGLYPNEGGALPTETPGTLADNPDGIQSSLFDGETGVRSPKSSPRSKMVVAQV